MPVMRKRLLNGLDLEATGLIEADIIRGKNFAFLAVLLKDGLGARHFPTQPKLPSQKVELTELDGLIIASIISWLSEAETAERRM